MNTKKNVEQHPEYITKTELKAEFKEFDAGLKLFITESFEQFAQIMARSFAGVDERFNAVDRRFDKIESRITDIESTMATKSDIMNIHDKFVPYYKFDELSLRVHHLEEKN